MSEKYLSQANFWQKASEYKDYISFLSESNPDAGYWNLEMIRYKNMINSKSSYERFKTHFQSPNVATDLISRIWVENGKVFQASDRNINFITKTTKKIPFDVLEWWRSEGWKLYRLDPNAAGIVFSDGEKFEVISIPSKSIIYLTEKELLYWDTKKEFITKLSIESGAVYQILDNDFVVIENRPPFFSDVLPVFRVSARIVESRGGIRSNILETKYPEISDLLYSTVLHKMNEGYLHANIITRTRNVDGCRYKDAQMGYSCEGGYLVNDKGENIINEKYALTPCPACNSSIEIGGVIGVPLSRIQEREYKPISFEAPDTTAFELSETVLANREKYIFGTATGKDQNTDTTKRAINSDLAIQFAGEGQKGVLAEIKKDLEPCIIDMCDIIGSYISDYQNAIVNLGEKFILFTLAELLEIKKTTDELGLSDAIRIDDQIAETMANGVESEKKRTRVIMSLNNLIGKENAQKTLHWYEFIKMKIGALAMDETTILKDLIKFYQNDLKKYIFDQSNGQDSANDPSNGDDPANDPNKTV
jgi:hypothetical protein